MRKYLRIFGNVNREEVVETGGRPLSSAVRDAFGFFRAMLANLHQHVTSVLNHVDLCVYRRAVAALACGPAQVARTASLTHILCPG
jgi:hypothetical protein